MPACGQSNKTSAMHSSQITELLAKTLFEELCGRSEVLLALAEDSCLFWIEYAIRQKILQFHDIKRIFTTNSARCIHLFILFLQIIWYKHVISLSCQI